MIRRANGAEEVNWFSVLPNGWRTERLKRVVSLVTSGVSVNASDVPAESHQMGVLKTSAVSDGRFLPSENKTVWDTEITRLNCSVTKDTIVVSRMNTPTLVGASGYISDDFENLYLPDRLWKLEFDRSRVHTPFMSYVLASEGARAVLSCMATGTSPSMKNLSIEELGSLSIPLPDKLIQERIAKFLSTEIKQIDGIIFDKEQMLALLEEKRKAYISRVVMHGLDSTASLKSSGHAWLGDIPTHWQLQPIKYLAHVGNGSTPSVDNEDYWTEDGFPWLNSSVVNQAVARIPSRFVTAHALRECHLPVIHPPAVLVGITGQGKTRGMASLLAIKATINQHLAYLKPKDDRLSANYLRAILMHAYEFLRSDSDGAGSTKGAITCEQLANTKIPIPPVKEQEQICSCIEKFAEKSEPLIANVKTSLNLLRTRRNALITAAVTGQIPLEEMTA